MVFSSKKLHDEVTNYRNSLNSVWGNFEKQEKQLEKFKGSSGYNSEMQKAQAERDNSICVLRRQYGGVFDDLIKAGREHIKEIEEQPYSIPTADEQRLLTVLNMRKKLTAAEVNKAAKSLTTPLAFEVLQDIAQKNNINSFNAPKSKAEICNDGLNTVTDNLRRLLSLEKPNSRAEMIDNTLHKNGGIDSLRAFRVDRDFKNEHDLLSIYTGLSDSELQTFINCMDSNAESDTESR